MRGREVPDGVVDVLSMAIANRAIAIICQRARVRSLGELAAL